jgi:dTDP-glucose pyrophosphorylase/predicted transcriptional regulator
MSNKYKFRNWRATLVQVGATIQQAIHSLEKSNMQIVLVISVEGKLIGTLTDGDIRRAFLKGYKLENPIDKIIHRDPLVVPPEISRDHVLALMKINQIHQLPIVDQKSAPIGLHILDEIIDAAVLENVMVIMAGGRGTRLHPRTENCPKPMLKVGGKPMMEHIIERAKRDGFRNFIISLNYLGEMIEDYFGVGDKHDINIEYIREKSPLGTAGSLALIENLPKLPMVITNGDVLTDIRYNEMLDFHKRHNAMATMAVRQYEIQNQFGVVRTKGIKLEGFDEKPIYRSHINAGIYVINPDAIYSLDKGMYCDMPTLFSRLNENLSTTIVYPMHEPWLDIGLPNDLEKANEWMR